MSVKLSEKQTAVQLVGADQLELNPEKVVPQPGPHQVLARVEAVGICFSDLKLLKQFDGHARKHAIEQGVDPAILEQVSSYVPGKRRRCPGTKWCARSWPWAKGWSGSGKASGCWCKPTTGG